MNIEQRSRQLGVLSAIGFTPRALGGLLLREAAAIALVGGIVGLGLAVAYTAVMVHGLRTWVGRRDGHLPAFPPRESRNSRHRPDDHAHPCGPDCPRHAFAASSRRRPRALPPAASGPSASAFAHAAALFTASLSSLLVATAAALIAIASYGRIPSQAAFLSAGGCLLIGGLFAIRAVVEPAYTGRALRTLEGLALRSAGYRPARAVLTASLIALASFTLVTVASMKQRPPEDPRSPAAGTGQNALIITADIPIPGDLNTPLGRRILGLERPDDPLLARARFTNLRAWQGQDASCLNMTQPTQPTILELPPYLAENIPPIRDARDTGPTTQPIDHFVRAVVAKETAEYILHVKPGDALPIVDQTGTPRQLVISTLHGPTIFQSEVLIPHDDFRRLFPHQSGFSTILVACSAADEKPLAQLLESELGDFSVTIESTADRLARFQRVANTYLSTFQALGSFGPVAGNAWSGRRAPSHRL